MRQGRATGGRGHGRRGGCAQFVEAYRAVGRIQWRHLRLPAVSARSCSANTHSLLHGHVYRLTLSHAHAHSLTQQRSGSVHAPPSTCACACACAPARANLLDEGLHHMMPRRAMREGGRKHGGSHRVGRHDDPSSSSGTPHAGATHHALGGGGTTAARCGAHTRHREKGGYRRSSAVTAGARPASRMCGHPTSCFATKIGGIICAGVSWNSHDAGGDCSTVPAGKRAERRGAGGHHASIGISAPHAGAQHLLPWRAPHLSGELPPWNCTNAYARTRARRAR